MDRREKSGSTLQVVAGAALAAAQIAVPDYAETRAGQRVVRGAMAAAVVGPAVWSLARSWRAVADGLSGADGADDEPDEPDEPDELDEDELDRPELQAVIGSGQVVLVLASVPLGVVSYRATTRLNHVLAARLASRGVRRPYTWVGLGWGVVGVGRGLARRRARG